MAERIRELTEAINKRRMDAEGRERVQEVLRQAQEMRAVTAEFAHDFNNSLADVFANLDLMRTRVAQGRSEQLGRYIEAAIDSATRASALSRRLLAFSRGRTFAPKPTDLSRLAFPMEELLRRTVGPEILVSFKLTHDLWLTLCDPNLFESALLNLVINARDAMPDGGRLLIETANTVIEDVEAAARKHGAR